jgi:hypothetical protein
MLGMGPQDKDMALKAIGLYERASGAKVNIQKTETIPLTKESAVTMATPGFPVKKSSVSQLPNRIE